MLRTSAVVILLVLASGCGSTRKAEPSPAEPQSNLMEVVPLQFAAAGELAAVLLGCQDVGGHMSIVADPRTNSLILCCPSEQPERFERALEMIALLDVEAK